MANSESLGELSSVGARAAHSLAALWGQTHPGACQRPRRWYPGVSQGRFGREGREARRPLELPRVLKILGGVTPMHSRPLAVTAAAILLALLSLPNLVSPLLPTEGIPAVVVYLGVVLGVAGLVGAAGLWMLRKWSIWLTIVVCVLGILSAAPGIAFGPNAALQAAAAIGVVLPALIIVLVVLPASRRAFATT